MGGILKCGMRPFMYNKYVVCLFCIHTMYLLSGWLAFPHEFVYHNAIRQPVVIPVGYKLDRVTTSLEFPPRLLEIWPHLEILFIFSIFDFGFLILTDLVGDKDIHDICK